MLHNKENNKLTDLSLQKCKALKQCEDIKLITFENNEFSGYLREANRQVGQILFLSFFLFFFSSCVSTKAELRLSALFYMHCQRSQQQPE